jgi:hypothetical protein
LGELKAGLIRVMLVTISSRNFCLLVCCLRNVKIKIYKTITWNYKARTLPVVLYGRETWSLTSREEHRLRIFDNKLRKRIFGLKRNAVVGGCRNLLNEELHNSLPNIIRMIISWRMRWEGHVACIVRRGMHIGFL